MSVERLLNRLCLAVPVLALALSPLPACAQETVTIPRSRLEELERKERELDQLKGDVRKTKDENVRLKKQAADVPKPVGAPPAEPAPARVSPPMVSLPPLKADEVVESLDLANYYRADATAADQRFRGHSFILRGEIVGFEKPAFRSVYEVLLKTPDRDSRVICELFPAEKFSAVFTADHGKELVGLMGQARVTMAKVGQVVRLKAQCRKWHDSAVFVSGSDLQLER